MSGVLLREKIELLRPRLRAAGRALWEHPRFDLLYPRYLFTMHTVIRASVPLMQAALERARELAAQDAVAAALCVYLAAHIPEEMHHDEWALDDLETLGNAREDVLARLPSATVAALVGAQYYWIRHVHPVAVLGYIAVLEGDPPTVEEVDEMIARTGFDRTAFRTVLKHALLDPRHRDDLDLFLDGLPLGPFHRSLIGVSALQTVHWFACVMEEIVPAPAVAAARQGGAP